MRILTPTLTLAASKIPDDVRVLLKTKLLEYIRTKIDNGVLEQVLNYASRIYIPNRINAAIPNDMTLPSETIRDMYSNLNTKQKDIMAIQALQAISLYEIQLNRERVIL